MTTPAEDEAAAQNLREYRSEIDITRKRLEMQWGSVWDLFHFTQDRLARNELGEAIVDSMRVRTPKGGTT
jgi:hypothetical protein